MSNYHENKVIIEKDLWYIENFFTEEEVDTMLFEANDEVEWTIRMGSPYKNIANKWLESRPVKDILFSPGGIYERLHNLYDGPESKYNPKTALQKFLPISSEEHSEYAMKWHYENETDKNVAESFIVYLNDDFEGGLLEFKYKDYKVSPKRGMIINIPVTEEFTHRVSPVSKNDRITFYGNCFYDLNNVIFTEVC